MHKRPWWGHKWFIAVMYLLSIEPIRQQKKGSCLVMCASNTLQKRRRSSRGLTPTPSRGTERERGRERDLWHSLCHFRGEASLRWQLHLSSTPAPPHCCGPDERWRWQSWGTKICVMHWLLTPHWQILLRRGSSSRLKMITLVMWQITNFHFQCQ